MLEAAAHADVPVDAAPRLPGAGALQEAARALLRTGAAALAGALVPAVHARLAGEMQTAVPLDAAPQMLDAASIDEGILVARLAQAIEAKGPAAPGRPARLAAGLRDGLASEVPDPELRRAVIDLLVATLGGVSTPPDRGLAMGPGGPPPLTAVLARLVVRAHQARTPGTPRADLHPPGDRLPAAPTLEPGLSMPLMEQLVAEVEHALGGCPAAGSALAQLRGQARLLAAREPLLWADPGHPWWRVLDRLLLVATVHDDGLPAGLVQPAMAQALDRLHTAGPLDASTCRQAADALDRIASRWLQEQRQRVGAAARALQAQADLQELQFALRDQILVQLRSTPTSAPLRRFLVGPWSLAMAHVARSHGLAAPELDALALQVDGLIRATKRPGRPVAPALQVALLEVTRGALERAGLPAAAVEAELGSLADVLRDPPPPEEAPPPSATETRVDSMYLAGPTRFSTLVGLDTALEVAGHARWLDALQLGDGLRLFLHDRWMHVQLVWVSAAHHLFVFAGARGDGTPALSRRLLARLRTAGLAQPLDEGALLALAAQPLLAADPGRR